MGVIQEKSYLPYVEIGKLEIGKLGLKSASISGRVCCIQSFTLIISVRLG